MIDMRVGTHDLIDLMLTLTWHSDQAMHQDSRYFHRFNVWRDLDLLPAGLHHQVIGQQIGYPGSVELKQDSPVPQWRNGDVVQVKPEQFVNNYRNRIVEPRLGRFYPSGVIKDHPKIFAESIKPVRITGIENDLFQCDLNHPLAGFDLSVQTEILGISPAPDEHGGRCLDAMDELLHGPGMQVRASGQPTEFIYEGGYKRLDESEDRLFYGPERMVDHIDARARHQLAELHGQVLPTGGRILDLMASFDSHLPDALKPAYVAGLGMNDVELAANPKLHDWIQQDLNENPHLPYHDDLFDAVVCSLSVEYLIQPLKVFEDVKRILKPGGLFMLSFSNRWFPPKVTELWIDLHEFERMGLVSEYLLLTSGFENLHTWSMQGWPRPDDDPYVRQNPLSDPLYAVWGYKSALNK